MASSVNPSHFVKTLAGVTMPRLIYGTAWKREATTPLVVTAIRSGFRGIDTACQPKHYFEAGVGAALQILENEDNITREELFIQTKFTSLDGQDPASIPYDDKAPLETQVQQSLEMSLENLSTHYLDSLVLHSPMQTMAKTMEVWETFETFVDQGKVRQLGISNCYDLNKLKKLYDNSRIKPAVLQNRLYSDSKYDKELRAYCKEKGIYYQSFWTLSANPHILKDSNVLNIAKKYGKTPETMFFGYLIQTGVITPLTGTKSPAHMKDDLDALDLGPLTPEEVGVFEKLLEC